MELFISIASFILILALLAFLRSRKLKVEIKAPDIIVAILPVMIFLIISGKLSKFELSESGLKIETVINDAAKSKISGLETSVNLDKLPTNALSSEAKGRVSEIPQLINQKTEALSFRLGYQGYNSRAIYTFLTELTDKPHLKYLIFLDKEGEFFAISPVSQWIKQYPEFGQPYLNLTDWLVNNNTAKIQSSIPGIITQDKALNEKTSRSHALSQMIKLKVDILPVLNSDGSLAGMVDRNTISSSLLLEITSNIKQ